MPADIPDYYKHLAGPVDESEEEKDGSHGKTESETPRGMPIPTGRAREREQELATDLSAPLDNAYRANSFTLNLPNDWTDKTVFTLTGPVTDGIQHNITVNTRKDLPVDDLLEFAEAQLGSIETELKGCRLLLKEPCKLTNGTPAYRAIFVWWPTEELRLYQEQIYVVHENTGYTLTASFSKKTRKTVGPEIERAMLSFEAY
jgi:hypothetical protein